MIFHHSFYFAAAMNVLDVFGPIGSVTSWGGSDQTCTPLTVVDINTGMSHFHIHFI